MVKIYYFMYTREAYPGDSRILFHYDGSDEGQRWPQTAPSGLTVIDGFSLLNNDDFYGPGGRATALTSPEATVLANISVGLSNSEIAIRYQGWFDLHATRRDLHQKLGVSTVSRSDEAAIAASYEYGAHLPETLPSLLSLRHDRQATMLQLGRLFGTGRACGAIRPLIGFSEDKIAYVCKQALDDLGLGHVERRTHAIVTLAGLSRVLLYPGQPPGTDNLLRPLTDKETARLFPVMTRIECPITEEPSTEVSLAGQSPESEQPDWARGNITRFTYRNARFDVQNDPESTGITSKELAAWVLRCLGLSYDETVEMFGSKAALEGAYKKLVPTRDSSAVSRYSGRKHILEQSVMAARKRGIIIPRTAPYLSGLNRLWRNRLVELTPLLGEGLQQAEVGQALRHTRGRAVKHERVNQELHRLRELLHLVHDGQLMLLGEAERSFREIA